MKCDAIVLAGGQNRRMGTEKWLLKFGEQTVIERIFAALSPYVKQVIVVLEHGEREERETVPDVLLKHNQLKLVRDQAAGEGPLAGMEAGFRASESEYAFVVASDMPFVQWEAVKLLLKSCVERRLDGVIPLRDGREHPLFAVYYVNSALPSIQEYRRSGSRKVMEWVRSLRYETCELPTKFDRCLFNMNTPDDYAAALALYGGANQW